MLNQETKRRIDSARDILVGKVPDPKAQVEQITTALIYKFMDDMDKESEELGGEASFFVDGYQQYAWSKLLDPRLGGFDRLSLYVEALTKMPQNPHLPQLFRDIFKDAFLPYRDPETLNLFLKEINGFTYDHSENLGNAFEYLLSVMDSQGDAGQFRTPRHIIDFIVKVVDPTKEDTILDPACGTAGFLISGYKHILQQNTLKRLGDQLTPDEKTRLMRHFVGYDISPEMVRLSLVNLYLHGFPNPNIREYDTLTSEERWDEHYDVIMANPPFMSPKGGIRPHKRFSIQANRSEVLFVDYIAEHLTIHGRAGVIVPEGIIFQTGSAYKALRKMLIEKYLWAVVSLPSGIFQPYSGVKTSILLMDKTLTKKADSILFVKVENDGFDLGAQRRAIEKNDLTQALTILQQFKQALQNIEDPSIILDSSQVSKMIVIAKKSELAKNGDYNLSGERYRGVKVIGNQTWQIVELGEASLVKGEYGSGASRVGYNGQIRYVRITDIDDAGNLKDEEIVSPSIVEEKYFLSKDDLLFARSGSVGRTYLHTKDYGKYQFAGYLIRFRLDTSKVLPKYVFYITKSDSYKNWIELMRKRGTLSNINAREFSTFKFPLPPLEIQHEIVAELESYQKIIDGARQVVENYEPSIKIDPSWEIVPIEEACEIKRGKFSYRPRNAPHLYNGQYPFIQTGDVARAKGGKVRYTQTLNEEGLAVSKLFKPVIVLITIAANIGDTAILDYEACFPDSVVGLIPKEGTDPYYLQLIMQTKKQLLSDLAPQAAQKNINIEILRPLEIPLPSLDVQKRIASQVKEEQKLVDGSNKLIEIFEQKIKGKIAEVWGELEVSETEVEMPPQNGTFKQAQRGQRTEVEQAELGLV